MTRITVDLSTDLDLNGESAIDAATRIQRALENAIGNGILTGDTTTEVDEYSLAVNINPDNHEDDIADYFAERIEDGHMDLESMPRRMARYGLMQPSNFIDEMRERRQDYDHT